jgi:phosphate transport system substrate-binding protein
VTGGDPVEVEVATGSVDVPKATFALGIFVNKQNPLTQITFAQLESIFRADATHPAWQWGALGLAGDWASQPVHTYGFDLENDKSIFFAHVVMHGSHRWSANVREFENEGATDAGEAILRALAKDRNGIAISNPHYANPGVKLVAIAVAPGGPFLLPTRETVQARTYPLARSVYLYARRDADGQIPAGVAAFLQYVLSADGQAAVAGEGEYLPLTPQRAQANLLALRPAQ